MMSLPIFLLSLVSIPLLAHSIPAPRGFFINSGASSESTSEEGVKWITDDGFIDVGNKTSLPTPDLHPILSSLRFFPDPSPRKYCYTFPVTKGAKYIVRTVYFYGGFDGRAAPPVFDQIVGGTKWSTVDTADDYAKGLSSFYEIVVKAVDKSLSVCLARNKRTGGGSPFISALEVGFLEKSIYDPINFSKYFLCTVARHNFGHQGNPISFPDDPFNRNWEQFTDSNPIVSSRSTMDTSEFWNIPPSKVFHKALTTSRGQQLQLLWPSVSLPNASYYIALYFQDNRTPSPYSWRVFTVAINGQDFYRDLNVTAEGVAVVSKNWPLSGHTKITMTPADGSPVGPVITAGEAFQIVHVGRKTHNIDVVAMEELARSLNNPPADWKGDPCLPKENSWSGVTCSNDKHARVVALNFTSFGLSGSLPPNIANLTEIRHIYMGSNRLSGPIPEISPLHKLISVHLEDNQLTGSIPNSLGNLPRLQTLYLQNNKLEGAIPQNLTNRKDVDVKVYGNNLAGGSE